MMNIRGRESRRGEVPESVVAFSTDYDGDEIRAEYTEIAMDEIQHR